MRPGEIFGRPKCSTCARASVLQCHVVLLQVRLAKEARELAVVAMQKEPRDDLAQHLMGRRAPA